MIRDATLDDLPAITAIYAHAVKTGTGSFEITPPDEAEMKRRFEKITDGGMPWLVDDRHGTILGYAYAGPFKERAAYAATVEDSIYVTEQARGQGVGKGLLVALIERCTALGKREMIAGIGDSDNTGSIAVHAACGFRKVGQLEKVGHKFERDLDVIYMQRSLSTGET